MFRLLADKLAAAAGRRAKRDPLVAASGYIVNTSDFDKEMVVSVTAQFGIDIVMVLDNERMYVQTNSPQPPPPHPLRFFKKKLEDPGGEPRIPVSAAPHQCPLGVGSKLPFVC